MTNITSLPDHLARLKFEIAALETRAAALKRELIELGIGSYVGREYVAMVEQYWRSDLDLSAVRKKLGAEWCEANSTQKQIWAVRTVLRGELRSKHLRRTA